MTTTQNENTWLPSQYFPQRTYVHKKNRKKIKINEFFKVDAIVCEEISFQMKMKK